MSALLFWVGVLIAGVLSTNYDDLCVSNQIYGTDYDGIYTYYKTINTPITGLVWRKYDSSSSTGYVYLYPYQYSTGSLSGSVGWLFGPNITSDSAHFYCRYASTDYNGDYAYLDEPCSPWYEWSASEWQQNHIISINDGSCTTTPSPTYYTTSSGGSSSSSSSGGASTIITVVVIFIIIGVVVMIFWQYRRKKQAPLNQYKRGLLANNAQPNQPNVIVQNSQRQSSQPQQVVYVNQYGQVIQAPAAVQQVKQQVYSQQVNAESKPPPPAYSTDTPVDDNPPPPPAYNPAYDSTTKTGIEIDNYKGVDMSVDNVDKNESNNESKLLTWKKSDMIAWINTIHLPSKWQDIAVNAIKSKHFDGNDLNEWKCAQDIATFFDIQNKMLCSRIWRELKKER